jgi:hypothetical protein
VNIFEDVLITEKTVYASSFGKGNLPYYDLTIETEEDKIGQGDSLNFVMGAGQMKNFVAEM